MSRIYDALIRAGKNPESGTIFLQCPREDGPAYLKWWRAARLDRKIFTIVAAVTGIFGIAVAVLVYHSMGRALRSETDQRGRVLATVLSDAAAGYVAGKNVLELDALIAKFSRLEGVAYVVIENPNREILIDSSRGMLREYRRLGVGLGRERTGMLTSDPAGRSVYEFHAPILEGQLGMARVALWEEGVQAQIGGALLPIIVAIIVLLLTSLVGILCLLRLLVGRTGALSVGTNGIRAADFESPVSNGAVG